MGGTAGQEPGRGCLPVQDPAPSHAAAPSKDLPLPRLLPSFMLPTAPPILSSPVLLPPSLAPFPPHAPES